jgi:hypothetical protein
MSNVGSKIEKLISDGFSYNTLRGLSESQINLLYNRLVEQTVDSTKVDELTTKVTNLRSQLAATGQDMKKLGLAKEEEMSEDDDTVTVVNDPDKSADGMGMMEMELEEKFESKSQQKFFWAKCENTKSPKAKKKWCKWAKEFSDKTPDFKKLPEKKETKEIEEGLTKLVEKYIPESITKGKLMSMIEQASAPAKPKEKERTTTKPSVRPGKANPFTKPGPLPGPKAGGTQTAPTKPTTKPTTKPNTRPGKANPFTKPGPLPGPKAGKTPEWLSYNTFISQGFSLK